MQKPRVVITTFESLTANSAGGVGKISYGLATHLHQQGYDILYITINKGPHETPFPSVSVHWSSRYFLFLLNRIRKFNLLSKVKKEKIEEKYFDFFLSAMSPKGDYFVSTSTLIPRTLARLKGFRKKVLIPPTPNDAVINELCRIELQKKQVAGTHYLDPYLDRDRLETFKKSIHRFDRIVSISPVTTASYAGNYPPVTEVSFVNFPQAAQTVSPNLNKQGKNLVFMYVGHSVLLKGVHRLLEEWRRAALPNAELHIVGRIEDQYLKAFDIDKNNENVKFFGFVEDLGAHFLNADVIVIPSLIDNEPQTAIEALNYGKPVLISQNCGYASLIKKYVPQAVFDIMETGALSEKMREVSTDSAAFTEYYKEIINYVSNTRFDYNDFFSKIEKVIEEES